VNVAVAPTFWRIAGFPVHAWMDGKPLPASDLAATNASLITTFDSNFAAVGMHLRTIYRDGHLATIYERTSPEGCGEFPIYWAIWGRHTQVPRFDGTEGELYACDEDPHQHVNLWADPARRRLRDELVAELRANLPPLARRLDVESPT